jgi:hypothetical protein
MNYFERVLRGRLFFSSERLPDKVIKFIFMEKSYLLEEFHIGFRQETDSRGRVSGMPAGGIIHLTFAGAPDYYINEWMLREKLLRSGEIRFLSGDIKVMKGADMTLFFEDAYCVEYKKLIHTLKGGLFTSLTVSPRFVKIRNEEFTNNWKTEENLPFYIRSGKE